MPYTARSPQAGDEDLRRGEQMRRALILPARVRFLVAAELLDRGGLPGVADGGTLALDDRQRQPVHEHRHVGDDVLLRSEHLVLARHGARPTRPRSGSCRLRIRSHAKLTSEEHGHQCSLQP